MSARTPSVLNKVLVAFLSLSRQIPRANRRFGGAVLATCFHASFLVGLFFDPEDGGDMFLRNVCYFQRITRRYIPEGIILHNHLCENLKSYIGPGLLLNWQPHWYRCELGYLSSRRIPLELRCYVRTYLCTDVYMCMCVNVCM
jgi:hypothetical protein